MTAEPTRQRLLSLDAFRGLTIVGMIIVNNPGSWPDAYAQLKHAAWNGWTITDWVFPFFLWIMGVAMTLSFQQRRERGDLPGELFRHVITRSVVIFLIGLFLNGFPFGIGSAQFSFATFRIPGVLQRIAVCYLIAGGCALFLSLRVQAILSVALLAFYWLVVMLIPVPGYGAGVLEPAGNLCWYVDSALLNGHTWRFAPVPGFDPEGIVSTIPAISTVLFGMLTGYWLRTKRPQKQMTLWMLVAGVTMIGLGQIMNIWLPINKNMWTSSFTVFMGGWALVWFGVFYWIIDVKRVHRWSLPLRIVGMNAILLYVLSELLAVVLGIIAVRSDGGQAVNLNDWLYQTVFLPVGNAGFASLLYAVAFTLLHILVGWVFWKRAWIIKV
jgi:predicted acyltransferase